MSVKNDNSLSLGVFQISWCISFTAIFFFCAYPLVLIQSSNSFCDLLTVSESPFKLSVERVSSRRNLKQQTKLYFSMSWVTNSFGKTIDFTS